MFCLDATPFCVSPHCKCHPAETPVGKLTPSKAGAVDTNAHAIHHFTPAAERVHVGAPLPLSGVRDHREREQEGC